MAGLKTRLGGLENTHRRFCRWTERGVWEVLLEIFIDEPDYELKVSEANGSLLMPHIAK